MALLVRRPGGWSRTVLMWARASAMWSVMKPQHSCGHDDWHGRRRGAGRGAGRGRRGRRRGVAGRRWALLPARRSARLLSARPSSGWPSGGGRAVVAGRASARPRRRCGCCTARPAGRAAVVGLAVVGAAVVGARPAGRRGCRRRRRRRRGRRRRGRRRRGCRRGRGGGAVGAAVGAHARSHTRDPVPPHRITHSGSTCSGTRCPRTRRASAPLITIPRRVQRVGVVAAEACVRPIASARSRATQQQHERGERTGGAHAVSAKKKRGLGSRGGQVPWRRFQQAGPSHWTSCSPSKLLKNFVTSRNFDRFIEKWSRRRPPAAPDGGLARRVADPAEAWLPGEIVSTEPTRPRAPATRRACGSRSASRARAPRPPTPS